jgi:hypothetical protein
LVPERPHVHNAKEVGSHLYLTRFISIKNYPERPTHQDLATLAKISKSYARKAVIELDWIANRSIGQRAFLVGSPF